MCANYLLQTQSRCLNKILLIKKVTAMEKLSRMGLKPKPPFDNVTTAHKETELCYETVRNHLEQKHKCTVRTIDNPSISLVHWADMLITVGGDGTFLNACHSITEKDDIPILGVNSSPTTSVGFFCGADRTNFNSIFDDFISGYLSPFALWRMVIKLNEFQMPFCVLNDVLFTHSIPCNPTRYVIRNNGHEQYQRSSGIWVSTSAGSTAAILSAGGSIQPFTENRMQYRIRELANKQRDSLIGGMCAEDFRLEPRTDNVNLFLDGRHRSVPLKYGDEVRFSCSSRSLQWVSSVDKHPRWRLRVASTPVMYIM